MFELLELRQRAMHTAPHSESLLNIPLVRQVFCDLGFRLVARGVDPAWNYERVCSLSVSGFNPFEAAFYYAQGSRFAAWLTDPFGSARNLNENDLLVREVLFMVHDYLHAWAYATIDELRPDLRVLHGPITARTLDQYAFCHLLTESAATVGLDYWLLSQREVNTFCAIGSNQGPLTVDYRESRLAEYRRACPDLEVQNPSFFRMLATFYCSGEFPGFDTDDIRRSPQLLKWLSHELEYGVMQRKLARGWLAYLSDQSLDLADTALEAPIDVDTAEQTRLIDELRQRLWRKVKEGAAATGLHAPVSPHCRHAPTSKLPDFRFVNLARVPIEQWSALAPTSDENFRYFLHQFLGQLPYASVSERKRRHVPLLFRERSIPLVLDLFGELPRHTALPDEPRDLMIAN